MPGRDWLIAGGTLSALAALLHLCVIVGGPDWYRFFGAGEGLARQAAAGSWRPAVLALGIAAVLATWSAYAFAGAGLVRPLPLMRTALVAISAIYLLRGLFLFPALAALASGGNGAFQRWSGGFVIWSSLIVLVIGVTYAAGTWLAWRRL